MDLGAYFLEERRFSPDKATGRLNILPPGAGVAGEHRRTGIKSRVSQLLELTSAPLLEEGASGSSKTSAERKALIHQKTALDAARLPGASPVLATEDLERAAFSDWALDRIVLYLFLERQTEISVDDAVRGVTLELEKVRAEANAAPSHMPLHYALGPVKRAASESSLDAGGVNLIERVLVMLSGRSRGATKAAR